MAGIIEMQDTSKSALFSQYAADYALIDEIYGLSIIYESMAQEVLKHLLAGSGVTPVLDIGSGTGVNVLPLLKTNARVHVTLVDISADMLAVASHILRPYADRTAFVVADINDYLQTAAERFEAVTSSMAIHNMFPGDRARLFTALPRVLTPNAFFVAFDKYAAADEAQHQRDLRLTMDKFRQFTEKGRPDLEQAWREHYRVDDTIRFTEDEQARLLRKAGLTNITWTMRKGLDATVCGLR